MQGKPPQWRVLLVGGSSGTGKTTLGRHLAQHYGVPLLLVDDFRLAIQAVTTPQEHPGLHGFMVSGPRSAQSVCDGLIAVAEALEPALRMVMAHHIAVEGAGPIILEGDGFLPRLASLAYLQRQPEFRELAVDGAVRGVILHEGTAVAIHRNMLARGRGFQTMATEEQSVMAEGSWRYGRALVEQALSVGVPVVPSRPFDTLLERVQRAIPPPAQ